MSEEPQRLRVVLLTTRERVNGRWLARQRMRLSPLQPRLVVVTLHAPQAPLRVSRTVVLGASVRPRRRPAPAAAPGALLPRLRRRAARAGDRLVAAAVPSRVREDPAVQLATAAASPAVVELCRSADAVVATDAASAWAAWRLARRLPEEVVVVHGSHHLQAVLAERAQVVSG